MPSTQHFVSPRLPTALADGSITHVDLPGQDIWFLYLDNVHVIPTKLDVTKFEDALSKVLQLYPHAAGQLRNADGRWSIELTNSAIPVDIEYEFGTTSDSLLDGNWVVQDDLSPFLNKHTIGADLLDGSAPLLRLKLTLSDIETCIGFTWNHSLGDAITISRLMHMLSQFYQGLPTEFALPTFKKYYFPKPSTADKLPARPTCGSDEAEFVDPRKSFESVSWRFDAHDLEELRSALRISPGGQNMKYVSKSDCLTAYLVAVLNKARSNAVETVTNVVSYRHVKAPFIDQNVASNLVLHVSANVPEGMAGIATAIRDSLIRAREPSCVLVLGSVQSERKSEAVATGKPAPFSLSDEELLVNSHVAINWRGAHFGCPDGARFYTRGVFKNSMTCFKSNPVRGDDGAWRARDGIDVAVGASAELKPKMLEILARGIRCMLDD